VARSSTAWLGHLTRPAFTTPRYFGIDDQGSCGGLALALLEELRSRFVGRTDEGMLPSRGGRLIVTRLSSTAQVA